MPQERFRGSSCVKRGCSSEKKGQAIRERISDSFKTGDPLLTFGGDSVWCAAGSANVEFLEEQKLSDQVLKGWRRPKYEKS